MAEPEAHWQARVRQARNTLGLKHSWRDFIEDSPEQRWRKKIEEFRRVTPKDRILIGTDMKGENFYLKLSDLDVHLYMIGRTRVGKSKFLQGLIQYHIDHGNGFGAIDPNADLIEDVLGCVARYYHRTNDETIFDRIVLVDPMDTKSTVTFNPLELPVGIPPEKRGQEAAKQSQSLVASFARIWSDSWGNRMEELMRNALVALAEADLTLAELRPFLIDTELRQQVLEKTTHPLVKAYFKDEYDAETERSRRNWLRPVLNKLTKLFVDNRVGHMFSYPKSSFNLRDIMDTGKILLVSLPKGQLDESGKLLGSLLMARIQMAAASRTDTRLSQRKMWRLYIDEFQNFAAEDTFKDAMAEIAKYKVSFIMAHQYQSQIPVSLRHAMGNPYLQVFFRPTVRGDADNIAKELFTYTGFEVKSKRRLENGEMSINTWSLGEFWEMRAAEVQHLPSRECYVKETLSGKVTHIKTADVQDHWDVLGMDEDAYYDYRDSLPIGEKYLVDREQIAKELLLRGVAGPASSTGIVSEDERAFLEFIAEHPEHKSSEVSKALGFSADKGNRIRDRLKEMGLIHVIRTSMGKRNTLAIYCIPDFAALEIVGKEPPAGGGGPIHRHIQGIVESEGISKGFKVVLEKELPNGDRVDVHLEKGTLQIAVEVSITSRTTRELSHIASALNAHYDRVLCIFLDERTLQRVELRLAEEFSAEEVGRIELVSVSKLSQLL